MFKKLLVLGIDQIIGSEESVGMLSSDGVIALGRENITSLYQLRVLEKVWIEYWRHEGKTSFRCGIAESGSTRDSVKFQKLKIFWAVWIIAHIHMPVLKILLFSPINVLIFLRRQGSKFNHLCNSGILCN